MGRKRWLPVYFAIFFMAESFFFTSVGPAVCAEKYPEKPVTLVITHSAGGATDLTARLVQPFLEKELGVPIVINNKAGAGGNIARSYVWKINPDGYNLLVSQEPSMSSGAIISGGDFDPLGFVPIYNLSGRYYVAVAVPYGSPIKTLPELIGASKKKEMTMSGAGVGSASWLAYVLLANRLEAKFQYVPFNSAPETLMAVVGGQVDATCTIYSFMPPLVEQKKIRMVAVLGAGRVEFAPDVPTAKEEGFEGVSLDQITAVYGPPGLPPDKAKILVDAFEKATKDPEFQQKAKEAKVTLDLMGPSKLKEAIKEINAMVQGIKPQIEAIKDKIK